MNWHCPYCGEPLIDAQQPHCGEAGHAEPDEPEPVDEIWPADQGQFGVGA